MKTGYSGLRMAKWARNATCHGVSGATGFSLIELLVVMCIIGLLAAAIVPAISSLLQANAMTRAGQTVADQINLARQLASTRSTTVEVRLVRLPGRMADGFNALQIWAVDLSGSNAPAGRFLRLPDGVYVSGDSTKFSPMLELLTNGGTMAAAGVTAAPYVSFRVRPSGIVAPSFTNSSRRKDLYLSVISERGGATTNNFLTVQVNPDTGNTAVYRPE